MRAREYHGPFSGASVLLASTCPHLWYRLVRVTWWVQVAEFGAVCCEILAACPRLAEVLGLAAQHRCRAESHTQNLVSLLDRALSSGEPVSHASDAAFSTLPASRNW